MLIQVFEKIQMPIIQLIIKKLKFEGKDLPKWVEKKREETSDIERLALGLLKKLKPEIVQAIVDNTEESYREIEAHIEENWGKGESIDVDLEREDRAMEYINQFVILALLSRGRPSAIIRQYLSVLDEIEEITDVLDVQSEIDSIIRNRYKRGLDSGYFDKNGHIWSMDRYVGNVEKQHTLNIYDSVLVMTLSNRNIELVQIPLFGDPRPACEGLQSAGGVICVVPRSQASETSQKYPNIYDPEHMYGHPAGTRGINCRHVWSAIGRTSTKLYKRIDKESEIIRVNRSKRLKRIDLLLNR